MFNASYPASCTLWVENWIWQFELECQVCNSTLVSHPSTTFNLQFWIKKDNDTADQTENHTTQTATPKKGRIPNAHHLPNHNRHRHQLKNQPKMVRLKMSTGNELQDDEATYRKNTCWSLFQCFENRHGLPSLTTFIILQCKKKKDKDTADQTENHKQIATKKKLNSNAHHLPDCNRQTSEKKTSQS